MRVSIGARPWSVRVGRLAAGVLAGCAVGWLAVPAAAAAPDPGPHRDAARTQSAATTRPATTAIPAGRYVPVAPVRAFDTRTGAGGVPGRPLGPQATLTVRIAGSHGVPADATAVAVNLTAVSATTATYLTAWPAGESRPAASSLNVSSPHATADFDVVALGAGGAVSFFNDAGSVNLLADIAGYYTATGTGSTFAASTPTRVFDTRTGAGGVPQRAVGAGGTLTVAVAGHYGVPAAATAVALDLTAVSATTATYLTAWPAGASRPTASSLNVADAHARTNFAVVKLGAGGAVSFFNAAGSVNLLADIAGYYAGTGPLFTPIRPVRSFDTRDGSGGVPAAKLGAHATVRVKLAGAHGVPADATAVALNLTAVSATRTTYVTAWPAGIGRPTATALSVASPHATASFAVLRVGWGGYVDFASNAGAVDLLADIAGYYTAAYPIPCDVVVAGVRVTVGAAEHTRTVVNGNGSKTATTATISMIDRSSLTSCAFRTLFTDGHARVGYAGFTDGKTRRQGTGTTPTGTYSMTEAFGLDANPGTALSYHRVGADDWWIEDVKVVPVSLYNSFYHYDGSGYKPRKTDPTGQSRDSELLTDYPVQYRLAAVVDFNRQGDPDGDRILGRGAGIFIHVNGSGATAGCVSTTVADVTALLTHVHSGDKVTIVV